MRSKHHDDYTYIIPDHVVWLVLLEKWKFSYKMHFDCFSAKKIQLIISFGFIHSLHEKLKNAPILPTLIKPLPKTHLTFKMSYY